MNAAWSHFRVSTDPGLETAVMAELHHAFNEADGRYTAYKARKLSASGLVDVWVELPLQDTLSNLLALRCIHFVTQPLAYAKFAPASEFKEQLQKVSSSIDWSRAIPSGSFRVTCRRFGRHELSSQQMASELGAQIQSRSSAPVNLKSYDYEVALDVREEWVSIAMQCNKRSLSKRHPKPYAPTGALKPIIAFAMLQKLGLLAGAARVHDPFCGSGTILVEARLANPLLDLSGSDISQLKVAGTKVNLQASGNPQVSVYLAEVSELVELIPPGSLDALVGNAPFGFRVGQNINFDRFYQTLLSVADQLLTAEGAIGLLCCRHRELKRAVSASRRWRIKSQKQFETGGLHPALFHLVRT